MQIPMAYAEDIIGVGGAKISFIRRTSGAVLTVQETRGLPDEITVEIKGSSSQVQSAQQLIQVSSCFMTSLLLFFFRFGYHLRHVHAFAGLYKWSQGDTNHGQLQQYAGQGSEVVLSSVGRYSVHFIIVYVTIRWIRFISSRRRLWQLQTLKFNLFLFWM